jgi:flagellar hook assembly protein FlgD
LKIYDITGSLVRELHDGEMDAGEHTLSWDLTNDHRAAVTSGIYFYRLVAGDFSATRKMVVLK